MSNGNRLSIPELEDQIAGLQAQLRSQQQRQSALSWYTCTRCSSFYTSQWGCGCPRNAGVNVPVPTTNAIRQAEADLAEMRVHGNADDVQEALAQLERLRASGMPGTLKENGNLRGNPHVKADSPLKARAADWDGKCVLGHCASPSGCEGEGRCRADGSAA